MGYAFISYSTKNQVIANAIRNTFIANRIDTWMAPYSITPGSKYAQSITNAIRNCSCFVLLLSNASQESEAVDSEVELAALTFKKNIVTIQIEEVELNDAFTFYIHNKQMLKLDKIDVASPTMKAILSTVVSFAGQTLTTPPQPTPQQRPSSNNPPNNGANQPHPGNPNMPPYRQNPTAPYKQGGAPNNYGRAPYGQNGQQRNPVNQPPAPPYQGTTSYQPHPQGQPMGYTNTAAAPKNKIIAGVLAIFLGGLGIHNFYLKQIPFGLAHLLFCWTFISAIAGLIEGIILLTTDDQTFNMKYNKIK